MDLVTEVRTLLNEATGQWWTDQHVYDGINDALLEMYGTLRWKSVNTTLTVTTATDIVAFDNTVVMVPQFFLYNNLKQFNTTQAQLEDWSRRWRSETPGRPKWFVLWDAAHFRVFPKPDATYNFDLWGVPWPSEINSTNTDMSLDPMTRKAIVLRSVGKLLELTQQQLSDAYMQESFKYQRLAASEIRNQLGANTWRLAPGVGWEVAQFGNIRIGRKYQ